MKLTTGGIGVDRVSVTLTGVSVYGNEKLMEWLSGGAFITHIADPGGKTRITLRRDAEGPKPAINDKGRWFQSYSKKRLPDLISKKFGQTSPINLELLHVNGDERLIITVPPPEQRAPLSHGRHKPKDLPLLRAIQDSPSAEGKPNADVTECHVVPASHTDPLLAVRKLVAELNALDKQLGGVKIQRSVAGDYRAVVEIVGGDS